MAESPWRLLGAIELSSQRHWIIFWDGYAWDRFVDLIDVSGQELRFPRLVTAFDDSVVVGQFYSSIFNMTLAQMDDVHDAMIENPDLEVMERGGQRRKGASIEGTDTVRMKR